MSFEGGLRFSVREEQNNSLTEIHTTQHTDNAGLQTAAPVRTTYEDFDALPDVRDKEQRAGYNVR